MVLGAPGKFREFYILVGGLETMDINGCQNGQARYIGRGDGSSINKAGKNGQVYPLLPLFTHFEIRFIELYLFHPTKFGDFSPCCFSFK